MAYDEELAGRIRAALSFHPDITEKRMFGGLAFLMNGHMICGLHKSGSMYRVGKDSYAAALALPGYRGILAFTLPEALAVASGSEG